MLKRSALVAGLACSLFHAVKASALPKYVVTPIVADGHASSEVTGYSMNEGGQVVGYVGINSVSSPQFIWTPNGGAGTFRFIEPSPPQTLVVFSDINSSQQLAGHALTAGPNLPAIWNPDGTGYTLLSDPNAPIGGLSEFVYTTKINANGSMVIPTYNFNSGPGTGGQAYLWTPTTPNATTGTYTRLHSTSVQGSPADINNSGQIAMTVSDTAHAVLWSPTTPNGSIGSPVVLPGLSANGSATPSALNDVGQVVGTAAITPGGTQHAFLWTPTQPNGTSGSTVDLGTLPGYTRQSVASDVNILGQVIGFSAGGTVANATSRPFFWTASDLMVDADLLLDASMSGWSITSLIKINDAGLMLAAATYDPDGAGGTPSVNYLVQLRPVPEPAALAGLAVGAAALIARRRRSV